jgi:hypothetical protein
MAFLPAVAGRARGRLGDENLRRLTLFFRHFPTLPPDRYIRSIDLRKDSTAGACHSPAPHLPSFGIMGR